jgi:hypothetical protein
MAHEVNGNRDNPAGASRQRHFSSKPFDAPVAAEVARKGQTVRFTLPRWSAGVVTLNR